MQVFGQYGHPLSAGLRLVHVGLLCPVHAHGGCAYLYFSLPTLVENLLPLKMPRRSRNLRAPPSSATSLTFTLLRVSLLCLLFRLFL
jgi:hypothetical protein